MNYFIKEGYKENINQDGDVAKQYTGPPLDDHWQVAVYKFMTSFLQSHRLSSVVEFGCGSGKKIVKYFSSVTTDITGLDFKHSIDYCNSNHSVGSWIAIDLDKTSFLGEKKFDLIMAIDVIEHLVNPELMLKQMKDCAHDESFIVISTPERDLVRGHDSMGPPENLKHVREWNQNELLQFLESQGLEVLDLRLFNAKKFSLRERFYYLRTGRTTKTCQVAICKKLN